MYFKWILKRKLFLNNLYINQWNKKVSNYFQMIINNKSNNLLKSLKFYFNKNLKNFDEKMLTMILNSNNFKNLNEFSIFNDFNYYISDLSLITDNG